VPPLLPRLIFALGLAGIGLLNLFTAEFRPELQPVPAWLPGRPILACAVGLLLVGGGGLVIAGRAIREAAATLTALLFATLLLLQVPRLIANLGNGGAWTGAFEILALAGAAWFLTGTPRGERLGRLCFAASLPGFGVLHFIYSDYVAYVIPAWIPAHTFWAYATGVAHVAAGASLATGVKARLAAPLLAAMFGGWVILLHIPRVAADLGKLPEWTSLFVCLAMFGASWLIAHRLSRPSP
jgi:uncharacterized membrane protein YphA (DoxX/SURF4 family)